MARILLGPVIGQVTHDTARVLLEVDFAQSVTMVIHHEQREYSDTLQMPARRPRVFFFDGLTPNTDYEVTIRDAQVTPETPQGRFRTLDLNPKGLSVAVLSCDRLECPPDVDMWEILSRDRYDVILHLGDNVYMDGEYAQEDEACTGLSCVKCDRTPSEDYQLANQKLPYEEALGLLADDSQSTWKDSSEEILQLFRQRYRDTWGRGYTAKVLATNPNIMILDDHEVRDDLGNDTETDDRDNTSKKFFLNQLALQVYHEYQRQLWDPDILSPEHQSNLKNEFFILHLGPVSVAMIDARTSRAMYHSRRQDGDNSYYGNEQSQAFQEILKPENYPDTRMWLICCPLPLLFFSRKFSKALIKLCNSNDDLYAITERLPVELTRIWDAIRVWKKARGPASDVIILGGDVHVGGTTDIYHGESKELVCRQVTTSPINNQRWAPHAYAAGMINLLNCEDKYGDYTYKQYDWINACNFLTINLDFRTSAQLQYTWKLVWEKNRESDKDLEYNSNTPTMHQEAEYYWSTFCSAICSCIPCL